MAASPEQDLLRAYCRDQDAEAFAALVSQFRPLVAAVCRKYLLEPGDLDDAVQETFVKLARNAEKIDGNVGAWLSAAAGTTALDFARQTIRNRRRINVLATLPRAESLVQGNLGPMLDEALEGLDATTRSLVLARFFEDEAVCEIARRQNVAASTISRQVQRAVDKLRRRLHGMGYGTLEEASVGATVADGRPLRLNDALPLACGADVIRVGVLVSHTSLTVRNSVNYVAPLERQLALATHLRGDRYRLITLVEPGTEDYPLIERGTREFNLTAGLADATDAEALKLLDVIFLGESQVMASRVLSAIVEAVESGVGLVNPGLLGLVSPGMDDPRILKLFMTEQVVMYHTPGAHHQPLPATVLGPHPLLEPLAPGTSMILQGCGQVFIPDPSRCQVLMTKDLRVPQTWPHVPHLIGRQMPVFVLGTVGRGRVAVLSVMGRDPLVSHPAFGGRFLTRLVDHLAEPRVAERAMWAAGR